MDRRAFALDRRWIRCFKHTWITRITTKHAIAGQSRHRKSCSLAIERSFFGENSSLSLEVHDSFLLFQLLSFIVGEIRRTFNHSGRLYSSSLSSHTTNPFSRSIVTSSELVPPRPQRKGNRACKPRTAHACTIITHAIRSVRFFKDIALSLGRVRDWMALSTVDARCALLLSCILFSHFD